MGNLYKDEIINSETVMLDDCLLIGQLALKNGKS